MRAPLLQLAELAELAFALHLVGRPVPPPQQRLAHGNVGTSPPSRTQLFPGFPHRHYVLSHRPYRYAIVTMPLSRGQVRFKKSKSSCCSCFEFHAHVQ